MPSDSPSPHTLPPRPSFPSQQSLTWLFVCFHTTASQNIMPTCLEKIISHTYGACLWSLWSSERSEACLLQALTSNDSFHLLRTPTLEGKGRKNKSCDLTAIYVFGLFRVGFYPLWVTSTLLVIPHCSPVLFPHHLFVLWPSDKLALQEIFSPGLSCAILSF